METKKAMSTHPLTAFRTTYNLAVTLLEAVSTGQPSAGDGTGAIYQGRSEEDPGTSAPSEGIPDAHPIYKTKKRCQRRAKKKKLSAEENGGVQKVKKGTKLRVLSMVDTKPTHAAKEEFKAAQGGWMGSRKRVADEEGMTVKELVDTGLTLIEWNGISPLGLEDSEGNVIVVLAGQPGQNFPCVVQQVTKEFERHTAALPSVEFVDSLLPKGKQYARGDFHTVVVGISYGGGQPAPTNIAIPKIYQAAAAELKKSEAVNRLAGFQNQAFETFFPKIHAYYEDKLGKLYSASPSLHRPHRSSIMPAAAYNLGPVTVCRPHRDSANLSFGICAITALGDFNPKTGGHLVLRELGVVTEFPPGATVLIPSAIVTHYNAKIMQGEKRYSFTQYAAGSMFCYIENGMRSESAFMDDGNMFLQEKERHLEERRHRWQKGLKLFPRGTEYKHANIE